MVTNRVHKVLGSTGVAATTLAGVTPGKYIVVDQAGAQYVKGGPQFNIVVGAASGDRLFSGLFKISDIKSFIKVATRAQAEKVITVALDTPVAGVEYNLAVIDESDQEILTYRQNKQLYTVLAVVGETATTLATKFRAKINADPASCVVASGSAANVVLTAKSISNSPDASGGYTSQYIPFVFVESVSYLSGNYYRQAFGTVTTTTEADFGAGLYPQLKKLEDEASGYQGLLNRTQFPVMVGPTSLVVGQTYDVYVIEVDNRHSTNVVNVGNHVSPQTIIFAVNAGTGAAFEQLFAPTYFPTV